MRTDILKWCKACLICATRRTGRATKPPLTPIPVSGPFDRVGVNVIKFPKSSTGNQYAVVFMDYLTKWPEVFTVANQTALTIAKLLVEHVISSHGVPAELLSDRGAAFLSTLIREVCQFQTYHKALFPKTIHQAHPATQSSLSVNLLLIRVDLEENSSDLHWLHLLVTPQFSGSASKRGPFTIPLPSWRNTTFSSVT